MSYKSPFKVCLVTGIPDTNLLVHRFVLILEPIVDELILITGNYPKEDVISSKIKLINIKPLAMKLLILRIICYLFMQIKFTIILIKNLYNTKVVIFYLEGGQFLLPLLAARLANKKIITVVTHSNELIAKQKNDNSFIVYALKCIKVISFYIVDRLIVYSPSIIKEFKLENYNKKIVIAHTHFIMENIYNVKIPYSKRPDVIGFIGRFSSEKGILNLLRSIPLLPSNMRNRFKFIIIGDGELREEVEDIIDTDNIRDLITLTGWMNQEDIATQLNNMKLLVIPSYTEGLVNVMLEAMACGTPVLANSVGAIPDIIKDNETGFIMANNSPESIALGISRAINNHQAGGISARAREIIDNNFSHEKAIQGIKNALTF